MLVSLFKNQHELIYQSGDIFRPGQSLRDPISPSGDKRRIVLGNGQLWPVRVVLTEIFILLRFFLFEKITFVAFYECFYF